VNRRFFDKLDFGLPDDELVEQFQQAIIEGARLEEHIEPAPEDVEAIWRCAREGGPRTRREAVKLIVDFLPCTWDDLQAWALDPCDGIRDAAVYAIEDDSSQAGRLARQDKARAARLIEEAVSRYRDDHHPVFVMHRPAVEGEDWREPAWDAANRLFDLNDPELSTALVCGFFEHVIPELDWGPEDRHIRPWIEGGDRRRKIALLAVAKFAGAAEGRMPEIVRSLASGPDTEVAALAKSVLDGTTPYDDLWEGLAKTSEQQTGHSPGQPRPGQHVPDDQRTALRRQASSRRVTDPGNPRPGQHVPDDQDFRPFRAFAIGENMTNSKLIAQHSAGGRLDD